VQIVAGFKQNKFVFLAKTGFAGCSLIIFSTDSTRGEYSKQDSYGAKKEF
jgi:hypothetical protein